MMARFSYKAKNGPSEVLSGELDAESHTQLRNQVSFMEGELVILHRSFPFLAG